MMRKFWAWLLLSSKDPEKASLTIKSILSGVATYAIFFTGFFHITVGASDINNLIATIGTLTGTVLMLISAFSATWGAVTKIYHTIRGTNEVINSGTTL